MPPPGFTNATISDNTVDSATYTDLQLGYTLDRPSGTSWRFYGNVNNVFDEDPPIVAGFFNFFGATQAQETLHDVLGRRYTAGFQVQF